MGRGIRRGGRAGAGDRRDGRTAADRRVDHPRDRVDDAGCTCTAVTGLPHPGSFDWDPVFQDLSRILGL